jgi:diguanylate cyclase (GGDEF)-like protein/PAS domain S-box-containing protein
MIQSSTPRTVDTSNEVVDIVLSLVDNLDAMVAYWDANRVCKYANRAYLNWYSKSADEIVGCTLEDLLGPRYQDSLPYIERVLEGSPQQFERSIVLPDGTVRHSLIHYIPDIRDGHVFGVFVQGSDITKLKVLEAELRKGKATAENQAAHDFLTGLPNRVRLEGRLLDAITHARHSGDMLAVMAIDLDNFKATNDSYGHATGDALLVEVATRMQTATRACDTVVRLGGDEFIILVPLMYSGKQIYNMADRILQTLAMPFRFKKHVIETSASLGISCYPANGSTPADLIENADKALYRAKALGKNRIEFADCEFE